MLFSSAKLKVERANEHILNAERWINSFLEAQTWSTGLNQEMGKTSCYMTSPPPFSEAESLAPIIGDAVHNLRSALDYIAFEILRPFNIDPETTSFPIDKDGQSLIAQPRYKEIQRVAPDLANIIADFVGLHGSIISLNHLDRIDKHRLLITTFAVAKISVLCINDENNVPEDLPVGTTLLVLPGGAALTLGSPADLHNQRNNKASVEVSFGEGEPFEKEPVIPMLRQLLQLVSSLGQAMETHLSGSPPTP